MSKRPFGPAVEDFDAATLRLGPDFATATCLSPSQVHLLLKSEYDRLQAAVGDNRKPNLSEAFAKSLSHVEQFARFRGEATVASVDQRLEEAVKRTAEAGVDPPLTKFECAQLASLCCQDVEEAMTLIPSLARFDAYIVEPIVNDLLEIRRGQAMA